MNNAKPAVQWLFLDLNAFFASCEQQEAPALRGKMLLCGSTHETTQSSNTVAPTADFPLAN